MKVSFNNSRCASYAGVCEDERVHHFAVAARSVEHRYSFSAVFFELSSRGRVVQDGGIQDTCTFSKIGTN